jgi:hypothetical protein
MAFVFVWLVIMAGKFSLAIYDLVIWIIQFQLSTHSL